MMRSPFFLPSGFTAQDIVNIVESKKDNRQRLEKIKQRKQIEKRLTKYRIAKPKAAKKKFTQKEQIQYGFDLAAWWNELHA